MTTLNISMPEPMRQYVEQQAAAGDFTASEYVRHLIRSDQERKTLERRAKIAQYLALCDQEIDRGNISTKSIDDIIKEAERDYIKKKKPVKKP